MPVEREREGGGRYIGAKGLAIRFTLVHRYKCNLMYISAKEWSQLDREREIERKREREREISEKVWVQFDLILYFDKSVA